MCACGEISIKVGAKHAMIGSRNMLDSSKLCSGEHERMKLESTLQQGENKLKPPTNMKIRYIVGGWRLHARKIGNEQFLDEQCRLRVFFRMTRGIIVRPQNSSRLLDGPALVHHVSKNSKIIQSVTETVMPR
jgi:hypothetical protein